MAKPRLPALPTPAQIAAMSRDELYALLAQYGIRGDRAERLREAVSTALREVTEARAPTVDVLERAMNRVESVAQREIESAAREAVRQREREQFDDEELLRWVTVGDDWVCEKCGPRHKWAPRTLTAWEAEGLPGDPGPTCGWPCRCMLVNADVTNEEIIEGGDIRVEVTLEGEGVGVPVDRQGR